MPQLLPVKGEILYSRPYSHKMLLLLVGHGHVVNLLQEGLPHDFNKAKIALGTESNGGFGMRRDRFCLFRNVKTNCLRWDDTLNQA